MREMGLLAELCENTERVPDVTGSPQAKDKPSPVNMRCGTAYVKRKNEASSM